MQRDNVRVVPAAGSYNPRPKSLPEHPADESRCVLHAVHPARQQSRRELGSVCHRGSIGTSSRVTTCTASSTSIPPTSVSSKHLRFRPESSSCPASIASHVSRPTCSRRPPKRRLSGSAQCHLGQLLVRGSRTVHDIDYTYKLPPRFTISLHTNQTFARAARGALHRAHRSPSDRQLRGLSVAVVLQPDSVRQPVAEILACRAASGGRCSPATTSSLPSIRGGSRKRSTTRTAAQPALQSAGQQAVWKISVLLQILSLSCCARISGGGKLDLWNRGAAAERRQPDRHQQLTRHLLRPLS